MSRFNIYCNYDLKEFTEIMTSTIVKAYVLKNSDNKPIDFVSYYLLPSLVVGTDQKVNACYLFLHTCLEANIDKMLDNLVCIAGANNMDVLNTTDIMEVGNALLTKESQKDEVSDADDYEKVYEHKFLKGSGKLYFNFFNWACPDILPKQLSWFSF